MIQDGYADASNSFSFFTCGIIISSPSQMMSGSVYFRDVQHPLTELAGFFNETRANI